MIDSYATQAAASTPKGDVARGGNSIVAEPGFLVEQIVAGSGFHTANGVAFGPDGRLYVASVAGESIFALDLTTGAIETIVGHLPVRRMILPLVRLAIWSGLPFSKASFA